MQQAKERHHQKSDGVVNLMQSEYLHGDLRQGQIEGSSLQIAVVLRSFRNTKNPGQKESEDAYQ